MDLKQCHLLPPSLPSLEFANTGGWNIVRFMIPTSISLLYCVLRGSLRLLRRYTFFFIDVRL